MGMMESRCTLVITFASSRFGFAGPHSSVGCDRCFIVCRISQAACCTRHLEKTNTLPPLNKKTSALLSLLVLLVGFMKISISQTLLTHADSVFTSDAPILATDNAIHAHPQNFK